MKRSKNWLDVEKSGLITGRAGSALLALIFLALVAFSGKVVENNTVSKGILFEEENWNEVLQKANSEGKLIFVNLYATWCGPCKMMKINTFSNKEVGQYFNENYISITLNGEAGKGLEMMTKYKLRSYPSHLFINGEDKVVAHTSGYYPPKDFLIIGKSIQTQIVKPS
jgi:thiol:disulfide interchange protein